MDEKKKRLEALSKFLREQYGERVARETRGGGSYFSQADMAREIGLDPPTFSQYYNGQRLPGVDAEMLLVNHYGNEISRILGRPFRMPDDPGLRRIAERWDELSPEDQERFLRLLEQVSAQPQRRTGVQGA